MFCKNCGAQISDNSKFCEVCGTKVTKPPTEASIINTTNELQRNLEQDDISPEPKVRTRTSPRKMSTLMIIASIFVIAVAVICFKFVAGSSGEASEDFYQEVNFNSGAFFAYDADRLYFIADFNEHDDNRSLFSTDYNGNSKTQISKDEDIIRIRVIDGKIYYLKSNNDKYSIGVMSTDGSENSIIVELEKMAEKYTFVDNLLYYLTDSEIHMCTASGNDDQILVETARTFTIQGKTMYYATNSEIYSFNLKNKEQSVLCEAKKASNLVSTGKQLYYSIENDGLYCISLKDGTVAQIINDRDLGRYTFLGDDIYYVSKMSDSERENFAKRIADSESDAFIYELAMIGCGSMYKMNISDGRGVESDSNQLFVFALYTYPDGLYCKTSAFSDAIEKVKFK